ncbi:unnamed protein product, partial [Didymodactylos carnosus]
VLKAHLTRCHEQFKAAKTAAKETDDTATIQLDWSENYTVKQSREEKGAYYFEQHISILSGYVWSKNESFSFGSLSDDTNHMSEAS